MFYNTCLFLELTSICARMWWLYDKNRAQILYEGIDLNEAPVDIDDDSGVEDAEVEEMPTSHCWPFALSITFINMLLPFLNEVAPFRLCDDINSRMFVNTVNLMSYIYDV